MSDTDDIAAEVTDAAPVEQPAEQSTPSDPPVGPAPSGEQTTIDQADDTLTLYLEGGQTRSWQLVHADAIRVRDVILAFWANPLQFPERDRVIAFGGGDRVIAWFPLGRVIGVEVEPVQVQP